MKTLHLSIIAILGIIIIVTTSVGVFMEKLVDNQEPYANMTIVGMKENYTLNEPIAFSVMMDGYGTGCGDTNATITKENDSKYKSQGWYSISSCASNTKFDYFKFKSLSGNTSINQAGNYTLIASFKGLTTHNHIEVEKKFSVVPIESSRTNNRSANVSTVIIPKDSDDPSSGKNYEPRYLTVVLGVNNTVQWINEADTPNTIVADTYNQPDPLFEKGPYSHEIIRPGKSFNFTFTKPGEFQYDTEPHPWLYGWVLVLPPSTENATDTVIVNDTKIPGPCEIFALPCPNSTSFTAQKFGSDVYIEKVTVNGVDKYAVVHPLRNCVYPPSYRGYETCRNPDDLAILRLVGVDTSIPQENINVAISGLEPSYMVGQPINFGVSISGYGHCDSPSVLVIHEGNIVWNGKSSQVSCPFSMQTIAHRYIPADFNGPFSLNQTGTYTVHVAYSSNMTEEQFNVTSTEGLTRSSHMKYTKANDPFGIIALVIYHPPDACMGFSCSPNTFYLKINSNTTVYLLGYNICDGNSCTKRNDLSVLLPIKDILRPDFKIISLPDDLQWRYGDTVKIQLEVSSTTENKTASLIDLGNSTIVP
jgi:plastocyanin